MKKFRWIPVLAYAGLIFYLSSRPWPTPTELPPGTDKIIHVFMYAVLGFGLVWALRATRLKFHRSMVMWTAAVAALLYGISDEIHQGFVPGREPSVYDVIADGVGSFIGAWTAVRLARRLRHEYDFQPTS